MFTDTEQIVKTKKIKKYVNEINIPSIMAVIVPLMKWT